MFLGVVGIRLIATFWLSLVTNLKKEERERGGETKCDHHYYSRIKH